MNSFVFIYLSITFLIRFDFILCVRLNSKPTAYPMLLSSTMNAVYVPVFIPFLVQESPQDCLSLFATNLSSDGLLTRRLYCRGHKEEVR